MDRLRIAQVTEYYYPHLGGICEHVHFFSREARRRGHHVDIITSGMRGTQPEPHVIRVGRSVPVYGNGSLSRITIGWALRRELREVLRRGEYDIVHVHTPVAPTLPMMAIEEARCTLIGTVHTYFDRSRPYALAPRFFQRYLDRLDAVIAVSRSAALAHDRYFRAPWTIVPNGIDADLFHPDAPPPSGWRDDVPTILFLGRFDPRNGLATLIDAFRRVKGCARPARLIVVGGGPLRSYYHRVADGDPDIHFAGPVLAGRPGYYAHSAVYACPTTKASFGITLLEAMACGTPIVCSDIIGFHEVLTPGREGLMVPCGDAAALADALAAILEDAPLRQRLGAAGREQAIQYSWSRVTDQILDVYATALGMERIAA